MFGTLEALGILGFLGFSELSINAMTEAGAHRTPVACPMGQTLVHEHSYYCLRPDQVDDVKRKQQLSYTCLGGLLIVSVAKVLIGRARSGPPPST